MINVTHLDEGVAVEVNGFQIVPLERTEIRCRQDDRVVTGYVKKDLTGIVIRSDEQEWTFTLDDHGARPVPSHAVISPGRS